MDTKRLGIPLPLWLYIVYFGVLYALFIPAYFILIIISFVRKKSSIKSRFLLPNLGHTNITHLLHACSLGEVRGLYYVIESLLGHDDIRLLLSVTTRAGYSEGCRIRDELSSSKLGAHSSIEVIYLPFEVYLPYYALRLKKTLRYLVISEGEYYLGLIALGNITGAFKLQLNGTLTDKALPSYKKFGFFYARLFASFDLILTQSEEMSERFSYFEAHYSHLNKSHAARPSNIKTFINTKVLNINNAKKIVDKLDSYEEIGFIRGLKGYDAKRPSLSLWLGASTHRGEDSALILAYIKHYKDEHSEKALDDGGGVRTRLLIAPRHKERFSEVFELAKSLVGQEFCDTYGKDARGVESRIDSTKDGKGVESKAHSTKGIESEIYSTPTTKAPTIAYLSERRDANIIIVDAMGLLAHLYALGPTCILGGSFIDGIGGHNPLEPALFACPIITGPFTFNQRALFAYVEGYEVCELADLGARLCARCLPKTSINSLENEASYLIELLTS